MEQIRELVALVRESNVQELTLRSNGRCITLRKEAVVPATAAASSVAAANATEPTAIPSVSPASTSENSPSPAPSLTAVTAPVVGIVRHVTDRSGTHRWKVGDVVEAEEVICIVESMRIPNEVHTPVAGRIASILVKENEPVEYDQVLMEIDTAIVDDVAFEM